jgi:addiction module RelB/DinJ family antitoxin
MASDRLQHRINPTLRRDAEAILRAQGIKPAQAITLFYTEVKRSGGLPFMPSPVQPSEIPNALLRRDLREAQKGRGVQAFKNKKDLFDSLRDH